jgi:hypothetical protein
MENELARDLLARLVEPLGKAELDCPACGVQSRLTPPFDLNDFRCPQCRAQLYPFARVDGGLVDLRALRELIAACHLGARSARELLLRLHVRDDAGQPIEPVLHRPTLTAHAIWAYLRWREPAVPWWLPLLGVVHPILGSVALSWACGKREERRAHSRRLLETTLSSESFDPCQLEPETRPAGIAAVIAQTHAEPGWPAVLFAQGFSGARVFGAREASSWSIAVDARRTSDAAQGCPAELSGQQFLEDVVAEALKGGAWQGVVRRERTLLALRRNQLDPRHAVPESTLEALPLLEREPRLRDLALPYRIVETASSESGSVIWSCLRANQRGALISIHCESFARRRSGAGAWFGERHVDADAWLAAELDSRELARETGSWLERLAAGISRGALTGAIAAAALVGVWLVGQQPGPRELLGAGTADSLGRLIALASAGALALRHWNWRRRPFPEPFWTERELAGLRGSGHRRRRRAQLAARLRQLRGRFDYSAPPPISNAGGAAPADSSDQQNEDFLRYAQDYGLTQAIVAVAERHGIDMSAFKERGAQQIHGCGVIAVRASAGAAAEAACAAPAGSGLRAPRLTSRWRRPLG